MIGANFYDCILFGGSLLSVGISLFLGKSGIWRRVFYALPVMLGASLLITGTLRLVPGDPIDHLLGDQAPDHARLVLAKDLGLVDEGGNRIGFVAQYGRFVAGFAKGNLLSFRTREPVTQMIFGRIGYTFRLALLALAFALAIGPLLGVVAAWRRNGKTDKVLKWWAVIFTSIPRFALAPILILVFSLTLGWLPVSGAEDGIFSLILPSLSLGL